MNKWWAKVIRDYFTFTRKERIGIFVLIAIGLIIYLIPKFLQPPEEKIDKDAFAQELANLKITVDSSRPYRSYKADENEDDYYRPKSYEHNKAAKGELFAFDPNTLDADGWKRLGLKDKTVQTIRKFVAKGFKFKQPEDIKRIYGLREDEANRLIPYIRINESVAALQNPYPNTTSTAPSFSNRPAFKPRVVDINIADTSALVALPGIGSKLAGRIVNFRDKLGGFASIDQVAETYGVPDSTFQKIKPLLQLSRANIRMYNINSVDVNELKTHPYLRGNVANAIVNYRKQHGNYKSVEEIKKIDIISDELFDKIAPYLKVL